MYHVHLVLRVLIWWLFILKMARRCPIIYQTSVIWCLSVSSLTVRPTVTSTPGNSGTMHTCSQLLYKSPYPPLATFCIVNGLAKRECGKLQANVYPYIMIVVCFGSWLIGLAYSVTKWCVGFLYFSTTISIS